MKSHFILVTANTYDEYGNKTKTIDTFKNRLAVNSWHLNKLTPNKEIIQINDEVAFYVSDTRKIVGRALIANKLKEKSKLTDICYRLSFKSIKLFNNPILFLDRLRQSTIMPKNPKKWGVVLMGGVRKVDQSDFELFVREQENS